MAGYDIDVARGDVGRLEKAIALPNGFRPWGVASTEAGDVFVGSLETGAIWAGDVHSGRGAVRVQPPDRRSAAGIEVDAHGRIFVAGGETGEAYVYDADDGSELARYRLAMASSDTFVSDVALTRRAAYLTDSRLKRLYVVPLGADGRLPGLRAVRRIPLTGDIDYRPGGNANGIAAFDGGWKLIVVQGNVGKLFRLDPRTGRSREIGLAGATVESGDGLLLRGRQLFVVQSRLNRIVVFRLDDRARTGRRKTTIADPVLDAPSTIACVGDRLYAVNARLGTPPGFEVRYDLVQVG